MPLKYLKTQLEIYVFLDSLNKCLIHKSKLGDDLREVFFFRGFCKILIQTE
jgi:hypothetical protein